MLRSDLRALRNLFRTPDGRRALLGQFVVLLCTGGGALAMAGVLVGQPAVQRTVRANLDANVVLSLHTLVLLPPLLFVLAMGTQHFRGELYRASHVPALLAAPVSSLAIVVRAFLRNLFGWSLFAVALAVPPTLMLGSRLPWGATPTLGVAAAIGIVSALAPILAVQLLLRVALVRWCSSPRLRRAFALANVAVFAAVTLALVLGFLRGSEIGAVIADWLGTTPTLPWLLGAPAALPAAAAGYPGELALLLSPLLLLACALPPLALAASIYRASYDVYCSSTSPKARARGSRPWPEAALRSLLRKRRAETLRVSSNLTGYAFLATVLVVLLAQGMSRHEFEAQAPLSMRETFYLLSAWQGLSLLVASISFLGVVGDEQKQIPLLATSPLPRRVMLRAKLISLAEPFFAMLLVTALVGPVVADVSLAAVGGFLLAALPILLFLLGVILAVGTWPQFIRVHEDMPLANNLRSVVPVLVIGFLGVLTLVLQFRARTGLVACYYGHGAFAPHAGGTVAVWLLAAAWGGGTLAFVNGYALARRNMERLLDAQA